MKKNYLSGILDLRFLVGFLGERSQFGWWSTAFYEASSRLFLEPVCSKTFRLAQYHGVLEAARRLHDEHLSVGSYHLFRLPEEVEQDLHGLMLSKEGEEIAAQVPQERDAALNALKTASTNSPKLSEGPTAVGNIKELDSPAVLKSIAGAYLSAFQQNARSYPYLVG
jgi:hypothetical protein